jgi:hypothetical protein
MEAYWGRGGIAPTQLLLIDFDWYFTVFRRQEKMPADDDFFNLSNKIKFWKPLILHVQLSHH